MPYAVTHVILTIVIADMYRDYAVKKKFSTWFVVIAGIAGLLPDMDIPLGWIASAIMGKDVGFHRLYTHSFIWFIALFMIGAAVYYFAKKQDYKIFSWMVQKRDIVLFFMAVAFGWFMHVFLDCVVAADHNLSVFPMFPINMCPAPFSPDMLAGLDAIILIVWLVHEQWRHEIKDYI